MRHFSPDTEDPLAAITAFEHRRGDASDRLLTHAAEGLRARGKKVCGVTQTTDPWTGQGCRAFYLKDLATGAVHRISQDRGRHARGCRLDYGQLAEVYAAIAASLRAGADVLILNRFGFSEAQGGGLRPLIEQALGAGTPVLIAVDVTYRTQWGAFSDGFVHTIPADPMHLDAFVTRVACSHASEGEPLD